MDIQRQGGFLIAKIHQLSNRILAKKLKKYHLDEINPAQGRILFVLWQHDGIPISELARRTSLGRSTLTSMLDRLEGAGYVTRVPSQDDRRKILVERSDKDRALQERYAQVSEHMAGLFYDGFSGREVEEFEQYLGRIYGNLTLAEGG